MSIMQCMEGKKLGLKFFFLIYLIRYVVNVSS